MTEQITPVDEITRRARVAVEQGYPLTACPYPEGTAAARGWQTAYHAREMEMLAPDGREWNEVPA